MRRLKYTTQSKPIPATSHCLQDMSNGRRDVGLSWSHFGDPGSPNADKAEEPNFCVACTDQEQIQTTGMCSSGGARPRLGWSWCLTHSIGEATTYAWV